MIVDALPVALLCPYDRRRLEPRGDLLGCPEGHEFPVVDGIPVLLRRDLASTHARAFRTTFEALDQHGPEGQPLEELGPDEVDPFVQNVLVGSCGNLYKKLRHNLRTYPIPDIELPEGEGRLLLDVGSGWGRWCVAAARRGYVPVGIDARLGAARAARRVARQCGARAYFLVADARSMPFEDDSFDVVYSFGVLQHFPEEEVLRSLDEIRRVLKPGGRSLVQMASSFGVRAILRKLFMPRELTDYARCWSPGALREKFGARIGPTEISAHAYLTLNACPADLPLLPWSSRLIVRVSEALRSLARGVPPLRYVADSMYVTSHKAG
jgi:SAM-dependent methyltransferase